MSVFSPADGPVSTLEPKVSESTKLPDLPIIDSSTRIPALDGLRGIAILLVLLCHAVILF